MTDGLPLQSTMSEALSQFLPTLRATRKRTLAALATGLHRAEHVHLSRVAAHRPGTATLSSKTMQLRRFLANDQVDSQACYRPLARHLLERAAASGRVRLLVDTLELSGRRQFSWPPWPTADGRCRWRGRFGAPKRGHRHGPAESALGADPAAHARER